MNAVAVWILSVALSVPVVGSPEAFTAPVEAPAAEGCRAAADSVRTLPLGVRTPPAWSGSDVPETVWRMAEAALDVGDDAMELCLLLEAESEARRLVEADSADLEARFALAAVLGIRADRESGRDQLRVASAVYEELERVLASDPEHARARHAMGRLQAAVMRMGGFKRFVATKILDGDILSEASWKSAEEHLAWAERTMPGVTDHHYELAQLYIDTGRPALAVEELGHVLEHEPRSAMERDTRRKALALLTAPGA
ncbi:MAG: hypothetical protein GWM92_17700 [Gemmatimonadetes bacterium]|nr:hypothetical protein [Gemmatimonadota bacterium]NIR80616.1 hypothetical protein [Gemmatimonadota bacterium]NIT89399.1 hypothetical protein [Gemmatimonadota bacterium]NIU33203.1 hypothetical protein [Gemmatimonadota bacterium]NIU37532.1 hypothetical protein [Gemmatimonadota bacterium]